MGLGLAVVQRYVEAHGGWVSLTSEEGRGSTFTLFSPDDGGPALRSLRR